MQKQKIKKLYIVFSILYLLFVVGVNAQQFDREVRPDTPFDVDFVLRTRGEYINAIEGDIQYDTEALVFVGIDDTRSTIPIWVEKFKDDGGVIHYSGVIPGGYDKEHVIVGVLRFVTKKEGVTSLGIKNIKAFRHDGVGTEIALPSSVFVISVTKDAAQEVLESKPRDVFSPDPFSIQVSRDQTVFEGKWFVVFLSHDKDSGIDHYEIAERRPVLGRAPPMSVLSWEKAESPYVLRDQSRSSYVYVRAIDKAGNVTISELSPMSVTVAGKRYGIGVIIFIALLLLSAVVVWRERKKKDRRDVAITS